MTQLGANAFGEVLEPGRVADCYLGLRLDPADGAEPAGVLVVAPAALLLVRAAIVALMTVPADRDRSVGRSCS